MEKFMLTVVERCLRLVGLKKAGNLVEIVKYNDGVLNSLFKLFRYDNLKKGTLVGTDEFGNRYYENNYYFIGRNRWVEFADYVGLNYDASQISPQWYGWMHHKTDYLPSKDPYRPSYPWMLDPSLPAENMSATPEAYMCYSTTKRKVQFWEPKSKQRV